MSRFVATIQRITDDGAIAPLIEGEGEFEYTGTPDLIGAIVTHVLTDHLPESGALDITIIAEPPAEENGQ